MTVPKTIIHDLLDLNPDALLFDNMDEAIIGLGHVSATGPVAIYSKRKIYEKLLRDGLSQEDADEYYTGKFVAQWAAEHTPVILSDYDEEQK